MAKVRNIPLCITDICSSNTTCPLELWALLFMKERPVIIVYLLVTPI